MTQSPFNKVYLRALIVVICTLFSYTIHSQEFLIKGKVISSEDSLGIPGVNIVGKGTTIGSITNIDGEYAIELPPTNNTLVFSSIGYESREVEINGRNLINVTLYPESYEVDEIVVTALGIKRESKALGYAAQSVQSDDLVRGNQSSALNALQGKLAGVDISSSSGAPGASTRITIRGVNSLSRSNQPLFVVDGIPLNNSFSGSTSLSGGLDFGNMMNDINPDDIESMNVLKGAAATALYGSRASNGVIIITLKKGTASEKNIPVVSISSSVTWSDPLKLINYQNDYGQGIYGEAVRYENMSWGPKFDQVERIWGNEVDSLFRTKPYVGLEDNVRDFFERGVEYNNFISISGGTEETNFLASYSNVNSDGIFPTNSDSYQRNTLGLRGSFTKKNRYSTTISFNYLNKKASAIPTGQGNSSVYNQVMQTPRDISLKELEDIDNQFNTIDNYYSLYTVNPYYILKKNYSESEENRVFGNFDFTYSLFRGTSIQLRAGGDASFDNSNLFTSKIAPEGNNRFASISEPGSISVSSSKLFTLNSDIYIKHSASIKKLEIDAFIGGHIDSRYSEGAFSTGVDLILEDNDNLSNTRDHLPSSNYLTQKRMAGLSGSLELGYNNLIYLMITARNDWSSTLPKDDNSFFYPGVSLSFVFTELMKHSPVLSFGKLRGSWAMAGNDAGIYSINEVYTRASHSDGFGYYTFPIAGTGIQGFEKSGVIGNQKLHPELSEEYEIGTDLRFFRNRIGIDATWYHRNTYGLIWAVPVSYTSGALAQTRNMGEIENKGIELSLLLVPVQKKDLSYSITTNFSKNYNKLVSLTEGLEQITINGFASNGGQQVSLVAKPGKPLGVFEGRTVLRDAQGRIVVDNQGVPRVSDSLAEFGTSQYKFILGINNEIKYKNISISLVFDIKKGGLMYSRTKEISTWAGTTPATLYNDRQPFIVPNAVYEIGQNDQGEPIYAENTIPLDQAALIEYWQNGGEQIDRFFLIDKSYMKLREASIYYMIPANITQKIKIKSLSIGLTGRNLWLWTPKDQYYIDPESTTFGTELAAEFGEYGATPGVRSWAVSLKMRF